jgi:hypothetical protein
MKIGQLKQTPAYAMQDKNNKVCFESKVWQRVHTVYLNKVLQQRRPYTIGKHAK